MVLLVDSQGYRKFAFTSRIASKFASAGRPREDFWQPCQSVSRNRSARRHERGRALCKSLNDTATAFADFKLRLCFAVSPRTRAGCHLPGPRTPKEPREPDHGSPSADISATG